MDQAKLNQEIEMDASRLYREEVFTDSHIGTIRRLTPVTADGQQDASRSVEYVGATQILTPAGALPLSFQIPADDLEAAIDGFGQAAKSAIEDAMKELQELQREAASQIVVPKAGTDPGSMGGMGGGGGIQMP